MSDTPTPRTRAAWKSSIDDAGCVTRLEPIWETMEALERELAAALREREELQAYADKLAQGLPCLPKDIEVLRDANGALAQENHELRKERDEARRLAGMWRNYYPLGEGDMPDDPLPWE